MATFEQHSAGGEIWQLMPKVIRAVGAIKKDRTNEGKSYKFRGIDEVLAALNPALVEHGVTPSVRVLRHKLDVNRTVEVSPGRNGTTYDKHKFTVHATLKLAVRFTAPDGSFVENVAAGEAMDYQDDKATNKAHAAAYKYAVLLGLCIPTRDVIDDSDTRSPLHVEESQHAEAANGNGHAKPKPESKQRDDEAGELPQAKPKEQMTLKERFHGAMTRIEATGTLAELKTARDFITSERCPFNNEDRSKLLAVCDRTESRIETRALAAAERGM